MKKLGKKVMVLIEKTSTGYSAYAKDLNVFSTGQSIPELHDNLLEALNMRYENSGFFVTSENLKLRLDLQQFFQHYRVLNAKFLAERIGMNPTLLSQYVRGIKNPSEKQSRRIIQGIQSIGKELAELTLV